MSSCCEQNVLCCNSKRIEKDVFERCYTFTSVSDGMGGALPDLLWEADGIVNPCGTLVLVIESIDGAFNLDLFLNGNTGTPDVANLLPGDSIIITSDPLNLIELRASAADVTYKVNLCLTINYECC